jgi:hypothetical protein
MKPDLLEAFEHAHVARPPEIEAQRQALARYLEATGQAQR